MSDELHAFLQDLETYLHDSFEQLWGKVIIDPEQLEGYAVIGALLSRQVTLAVQLARSPNAWNGHAAPLFLRPMVDLHITLAWMMDDLPVRTKLYLLHGLGEEKLQMEQYKAAVEEDPNGPLAEDMRRVVEIKERWINAQRRDLFIEVNLGHWAQLDTRKMSIETGNEGLYKFAYKPFSSAAHNMWPHVSVYNARVCTQSLHRYHLVPTIVDAPLDLDFLYRACKYVHKVYGLFTDNLKLEFEGPLPLDWWAERFSHEPPASGDDQPGTPSAPKDP